MYAESHESRSHLAQKHKKACPWYYADAHCMSAWPGRFPALKENIRHQNANGSTFRSRICLVFTWMAFCRLRGSKGTGLWERGACLLSGHRRHCPILKACSMRGIVQYGRFCNPGKTSKLCLCVALQICWQSCSSMSDVCC